MISVHSAWVWPVTGVRADHGSSPRGLPAPLTTNLLASAGANLIDILHQFCGCMKTISICDDCITERPGWTYLLGLRSLWSCLVILFLLWIVSGYIADVAYIY